MNIKTIKKAGYNLHLIKNNNYKSIFIKIFYWNDLKKEELACRNLLLDNLLFSSSKYPSTQKISIRKKELYNIELYGETFRKGNQIITEINFSALEDQYTEKGNIKNSIDFLFECLNNPNIKNDAFDKESFTTLQSLAKTYLKNQKESPLYQGYQEFKKMIGDSHFLGSIRGTKKAIDSVTPRKLYDYYKTFFKNNHIDIFVLGNIEDDIINEIDKHINLEKNNLPYRNVTLEYQKEFSEKEKKSKFNQSLLFMGSSIKKLSVFERKYPVLLYNIILGNSPASKLFTNVREKKSYAYSISSSINRLDGLFLIEAGISSKNFTDTKLEVYKQLNLMKEGKFSLSSLKSAKEMMLSSIKSVNDSAWSIINYHFNNKYFNIDDIEIQKEYIQKITKEDIVKVANKINIDTIFLLKEDQNEKNKN